MIVIDVGAVESTVFTESQLPPDVVFVNTWNGTLPTLLIFTDACDVTPVTAVSATVVGFAVTTLPPAVVLLTVNVTVTSADCEPLAIINTCPV